MHQEGPIPRTGAINSIERAQKLVANPNPIPKFPMAENYQKHEVNSDVKVSSQTVSRTHPTNPTIHQNLLICLGINVLTL